MLARQAGSGWEVLAPAKLNLYLEILGRRDDGFHELETLVTPIRLFDRLTWAPAQRDGSPSFSLQYDPSTSADACAAAPADSTNLVWRAFDLMARGAGIEPTGRVTLAKRIPIQAGLGGASSDAAAALVLANAAWELGYSRSRLSGLAAQLGSDVPFFLGAGAAICRGRGEQITPVRGLPRLDLVVIKPPGGVSTAQAYGSIQAGPTSAVSVRNSHARVNELVQLLRRYALAEAARRMKNRLESAAVKICPTIAMLREALSRCACHGHLMTGSGSAYFGVMRSARQARQAARQLAAWKLGTVFAAATCRAASPA
jgi:4-diphosphocytidyl-2-C-methyl-D-erythritol kinase